MMFHQDWTARIEKPYGIYLDHQATDRPRPEAIQAVSAFMGDYFGNAGAVANERGRLARRHLEACRDRLADFLGAEGEAVIFTSGATESNNLVVASEGSRPGAHLVVSRIEHKCVLESAMRARQRGTRLSLLPVDGRGVVDLDALAKFIRDGASCVSVMTANNEVGTVQPIDRIAHMCAEAGVSFHTDAAQAVGKMPLTFTGSRIDYLSLSAHKFGGPQGIGALICTQKALDRLEPLLVGGGQEQGVRSGTVPVALCAGMAAAAAAIADDMDEECGRLRRLRDRLIEGLRETHAFFLNSSPDNGLCNSLNGGFTGIPALALMRRLPEIQFSLGSACTSGRTYSHVLQAMGLHPDRIESSFRLSVGWSSSEDDVETALEAFRRAVATFGRARQGRSTAGEP